MSTNQIVQQQAAEVDDETKRGIEQARQHIESVIAQMKRNVRDMESYLARFDEAQAAGRLHDMMITLNSVIYHTTCGNLTSGLATDMAAIAYAKLSAGHSFEQMMARVNKAASS